MGLSFYPLQLKIFSLVVGAALLQDVSAQAPVPNVCGAVDAAQAGGYGPFDYRTRRDKVGLVEKYHFTPKVEALIAGESGYIGGDLSYLMRHFPNHHRGLMAIMRFVGKTKNPQPPHMQYTMECYFDRAIRFAPDDTVVRVLYARYLFTANEKARAEGQLTAAGQFAGDNPLSHFNIGLAFFDIGNYEQALQQAHKVKALGLDQPVLEQKLRDSGHWRDPSN